MKKTWLVILVTISICAVTGLAQPVWAHDDGTMHIHIKGTLKTDKGSPIAGAQLDLNSVRGAIYPPSFTVSATRQGVASKCISDVVPVINPTNKEGYYEVIAKFKNSYQESVVTKEGVTFFVETDCWSPAKYGTFTTGRFHWTKDGMVSYSPQ